MSAKGIAIAIIFLSIGVFGGLSADCLIHRFGAFKVSWFKKSEPTREITGITEVEAGNLATGVIYFGRDDSWAFDNKEMRTSCDPAHPLYFFPTKPNMIQYVCTRK